MIAPTGEAATAIIVHHRQIRTSSGRNLMTVRTPTRPIRTSARDGFIIVAVLWILAALAALATIYSIYIKNSALAVSVMDDELQAEALVSASLELTAYQLAVPNEAQAGQTLNARSDSQRPPDAQRATEPQRPTRGQFGFRLGRANILVSYSSEAARIDLNAAPKASDRRSSLQRSVHRVKTRIATPIESSVGVNLQSEADQADEGCALPF